jgi:hypothetical protein
VRTVHYPEQCAHYEDDDDTGGTGDADHGRDLQLCGPERVFGADGRARAEVERGECDGHKRDSGADDQQCESESGDGIDERADDNDQWDELREQADGVRNLDRRIVDAVVDASDVCEQHATANVNQRAERSRQLDGESD